MANAARRDVAPFLQRLRAFLLGREHTVAVRFEDGLADRTQPPPDVPGGPAHILSANYYCNRDPRREVAPPIDLVKQSLIAGGESGSKTSAKLPTPGKVYQWD
ncbi:NADH dehydrogenase [ubiquinone] 1 alpha subcomplex subunit 7 [Eupeodes corollae]|uniref:NADH dehydrogenase [ubiquinone] 1 alpha subcomplex subunit 7 n=1 Tax=Eupeodes corollae TaxID=290404 RepID=UPI00248FA577|nr:NADH dehydrogenase [ubiquinone] 1 alpha subcomplex subunit 7 [Eupeodes corollae]